MLHDLAGVVTIGQNIKQVSSGDEVETRELCLLGCHEIVQGLLANFEFFLDSREILFKSADVAELQSVLYFFSLLEEVSDFRVDANE